MYFSISLAWYWWYVISRPGPDNSVRGGQLCSDRYQVHQSDGGFPRSGGENYQLSDWGVPSWLSLQEISSQAGGHLPLCSLLSQVSLFSLYWEGTRSDDERQSVKLSIRWGPAALRILIVLRVCQQCQQWRLRTVWSSVREPLWMLPSLPVSGRRLWWTASSESINYSNIFILIISVIHRLWKETSWDTGTDRYVIMIFLDIVFNNQLKLVQISFTSSTFDRIDKEC